MNSFCEEEKRDDSRAFNISASKKRNHLESFRYRGVCPAASCATTPKGWLANDKQLAADILIFSEVRTLQVVVSRPLIAGAKFE